MLSLSFRPRVPLTGSLGQREKGTDSAVSGNTKSQAVPIELIDLRRSFILTAAAVLKVLYESYGLERVKNFGSRFGIESAKRSTTEQ